MFENVCLCCKNRSSIPSPCQTCYYSGCGTSNGFIPTEDDKRPETGRKAAKKRKSAAPERPAKKPIPKRKSKTSASPG